MSGNERDQARAYVRRLRREGRTDEQIRQLMLGGGWSEEQFDDLLGAWDTADAWRIAAGMIGEQERAAAAGEPAPKCPNCRAEVHVTDDRCLACGAILDAGEVVAPPPPVAGTEEKAATTGGEEVAWHYQLGGRGMSRPLGPRRWRPGTECPAPSRPPTASRSCARS